jgi:hypothetical protein
VLVEGRLADADVGQHLVQAHVAEAVAVETSGRRSRVGDGIRRFPPQIKE